MGQHSQYNDLDICWNIWVSNLGRNKRTISSAKHPDQFQWPPSLHLNENQSFFCGSKVARADSLNTHIHLEPSLKISGAIPPINCSVSMAHIGTIVFYRYFLPMYVSLKRSHSLWSQKWTFLYITHLLHAHYMTHLFHLYWSNYINIMNSSNNKPHYIIFCVLAINSLYTLLIIFLKLPQNMLFLQCKKSHFTPIKMKEIFDLLIDETLHCKWYCTCSESQNKDLFS